MDKAIDRRFERLEKALSSLIDSVAKYHPCVAQADELRAADSDLNNGLEQVQLHQDNYLRIQKLRQTSAALDAQIRDTLTSLATTRKDIVSTPTTKFATSSSYPVVNDELLSYAHRISKTTLPPASTIAINGGSASPEAHTQMPDGPPQSAMTPSAQSPTHFQSPMAVNGSSQPANDVPQSQQPLPVSMNTSLPEGMSQYLNPLSGQVFFPWPLEDRIRCGSLASNQMLAEQGIDPRGYDPATEEKRRRKEEEERKTREEREKMEREERERQIREDKERLRVERENQREKEQDAWRRASIAGQPDAALPTRTNPVSGEKKQFQFTNLDDLDDDDDDDDDDD